MNREEIVAQVNQLMQQGFEIEENKLVPEATLFDDLGLDSLDAIDMLVHLEDKLKIKVDGERIKSVRTLEDIYALVAAIAAPQSNTQSQSSH